MKGSNKNILFFLVVLMVSSLVLLSVTVQAEEKKEEEHEKKEEHHKDEHKKDGHGHGHGHAPAPSPGGGGHHHDHKKDGKASVPSPAEGGDPHKLECVKFIEKINNCKETTKPAAKESCGRAVNTLLCEKTVMEINIKEGKELNPKTIIALEVKAMQVELAFATKDSPAAGKEKAHETCAGSYKKADAEMAGVTDSTETNSKLTLIQGAMKHIQACQTEIEAEKITNSPLKAVNDFLLKTGENIIALETAVATGALKAKRK